MSESIKFSKDELEKIKEIQQKYFFTGSSRGVVEWYYYVYQLVAWYVAGKYISDVCWASALIKESQDTNGVRPARGLCTYVCETVV